MATINQIKQQREADTPILFFQCVLPSGDAECWSTHALAFNGGNYSARVLKHNLFNLQLSSDDAMDGISQLSLTLANADSALSELNSAIGFKGSQLTVYFAFADLPSGTITTESTVLFRGIAGDPDEITEEALTLNFTNKLSLQRIPVPEIRIQRSCAWNFPGSAQQRAEATGGSGAGVFSRYFRCGYSAGLPGGLGNLSTTGQPFTSCDKSRGQCTERGMFGTDAQGNGTKRFGGFEFVPSAISVRTAGDKTSHVSPLIDNAAKYNDPVPLVYGTGWLKAPVIFARNDGNLTHMEVLAGLGPIENILKVVVDDVEIPSAAAGQDMTTTGWFRLVTSGKRTGNFSVDFADSAGYPLGDPYGSMAVLSVVVPNRVSSGKSLPTVEVLLQGAQVESFDANGISQGTAFSNNPAWVILDLLRRCGWSMADLAVGSFANSAAFCQELISTTDLNGNAVQVPRYQCNLILTKRQSAASVIRGIRVASSLMLRYGASGLLELVPETTLARQQPSLLDGANSTDLLNAGWPAYEFSDSSGPFSGIARDPTGNSTVILNSRSIAETSNRLSIEFQDESNEYQQDSLSLVDAVDSALIGYEISSQSTALGIPNYSQATRVLLRQLDKSTKGNLFLQFETSFRALKVRPGDIIAVTYLKEGFARTPFRVVKLSPTLNYALVTIYAQIHDDDWYSDNPAVLMNAGRQPGSSVQTPRPLIGLVSHQDARGHFEYFDFGVEESIRAQKDGSATDTLTIAFAQPTMPNPNSPTLPLLSLAPQYQTTGGTLSGGAAYYYAVAALDSTGREGTLSFTVPAAVPVGTNTNTVSIVGMSFPTTAATFNVYRGTTPQQLYRIASGQALSSSFVDLGFAPQPIGPPDASFDHANFYYRFEYGGPYPADIFSAASIGWCDLGAVPLAYSGRVVRIIEGTGKGQERAVASNDPTTLMVSPAWSVTPDGTSVFVIAEGSWHFGAVTATSPAVFEIGYQAGTVLQISGRGANVNNQEGSADLCPLTRVMLGGGSADAGLPAAPLFSVAAPGAGLITVSQIGFADLSNTSSVTSGTLQLYSWDELHTPSPFALAGPLTPDTTVMPIPAGLQAAGGDVIQIGQELITVLSADASSGTYTLLRGSLSSSAAAHNPGDAVFPLDATTIVLPFASGFFENRAALNFLHTSSLPDRRVCAAQCFVTNAFGNSQASKQCYTPGPEGGLRTLSGGQFSIQSSGYLATQQSAAPPLLVEASHAVRDIRASLTQAASGYTVNVDLVENGNTYCSLQIPSGATASSTVIDGMLLPPLNEGAMLTMNVALVPLAGFTGAIRPGRDLTVTVRF